MHLVVIVFSLVNSATLLENTSFMKLKYVSKKLNLSFLEQPENTNLIFSEYLKDSKFLVFFGTHT